MTKRLELKAPEKTNPKISRMTQPLQEPRASFYRCQRTRDAPPGPQAVRHEQIDAAVQTSFKPADEVYDPPRVTADLHAEELPVNVKTIAASMRQQDLEKISPRMFTPITTTPSTLTHRTPNRVKRQWTPAN